MAKAPIGKTFVEIDLDAKKYVAGIAKVKIGSKKELTEMEQAWRGLGSKAELTFDKMRQQAISNYEKIKRSVFSTADDIVRAEKAKNDKIARINKQQFGEQTSLLSMVKKHWMVFSAAAIGAIYAIQRALKESVSGYAVFEVALNRLGNVSDETISSMRAKILSISPALGTVTELTKGYYQVLSAGVTDPIKSMELLTASAKMSKEATIEQSESVKGIAALMGAYADELKTATDAADLLYKTEKLGITAVGEMVPLVGNLANMARSVGLSANEMAAALAQITTTGAGTNISVTQLQGLLTALSKKFSLLPPKIQEYGSAIDAVKALGFQGVLKEIMRYTDGNSTALVKMLGRQEGYLALLQLSKNEFGDYSERLEEMTNKTGAFDDAWKRYAKTLTAIWDTFKNTIGRQAVLLGEKLAPKIKEVTEKVSAWIEKNDDLIAQKMPEYVNALMSGLTTVAIYAEKTAKFMVSIKDAMKAVYLLQTGRGGELFLPEESETLSRLKVLKDIAELERQLTNAIKWRQRAEEKGNQASIKIYNIRITQYKTELDVLKKKAGIETTNIAKISKLEQAKNKELLSYMDDLIKAQVKTEKKVVDVHVKATKQYLSDEQIKNKNLLAYMDDLIKAEQAATKNKTKAVADYARESTNIYERLFDDVQKLDLGDYEHSLALLDKRYENYKTHLENLAIQDSKYAGGVQLLDKWIAGEKQKLWDDWAKKHGTVLDRLELRWRDYQKEGINTNKIMYDAISAGAANLEKQLSDVFFNVLTGNMSKVSLDWDAMWASMVRSTTDHMARIVTETALNVAAKAASAGMDWLGQSMGWWAAGSWEIKKQHMAMLHPGEMVIPTDMADKIRDGSGNIGLGEPMLPELSTTIPGSFRDVYVDNAIKSALYSAAKGFGVRTVLSLLMGTGMKVNPWGVMGAYARAAYKGYMGHRDAKKLYSLIYGKDAPYNPDQNVQQSMQAIDWSGFDAHMAEMYPLMAINNPGYDSGGGAGGDWSGFGGFGDPARGGFGFGDFGFARGGGLFSRPTIMGEHGPEWAVPTYEPERSRFLKNVGADPDKLAAAIANKLVAGGNITINTPLIHIGGNLIADKQTFDDFVEQIDYTINKRNKRVYAF